MPVGGAGKEGEVGQGRRRGLGKVRVSEGGGARGWEERGWKAKGCEEREWEGGGEGMGGEGMGGEGMGGEGTKRRGYGRWCWFMKSELLLTVQASSLPCFLLARRLACPGCC